MTAAPCPVCQVPCPAEVLVFDDRGQRVTQTITRCATHGRGVARDVAPSTTEPNSAPEPAPKQLAAGYRGEHACEGCGARFETTFPAKRFCSTECRVEVRRKQLEAQRRARGAPIRQRREKGAQATRICALEACGAEFALLPGKPHQRFCSRPCAYKGRQAQQQRAPRENRQCPTCGESFEVRASSLQRFCSRSCGRTQVKGEPEYEPEGFNESQGRDRQPDSLRESPAPGRWIAVEVMARLERPHRLAGWCGKPVSPQPDSAGKVQAEPLVSLGARLDALIWGRAWMRSSAWHPAICRPGSLLTHARGAPRTDLPGGPGGDGDGGGQ